MIRADALEQLLARLIVEWESECVEFKDANDNYPTSEIGKYFSALSNEANLRDRESGWLVFGVDNKTRRVIGTTYREDGERLMSLKQQIGQSADPTLTFREIHVLPTAQGRVLMFAIPAAPRGMPIGWNGHYYARHGESLVALSIDKLEAIRAQGATEDWSAAVCSNASLADLDPDAVSKAREVFSAKFQDRLRPADIDALDDAAFLDRAKVTIGGRVTRAAVLLLGRRESTHHLSPTVAELTWKLEGEETAYEHFAPPFLLETSRLYQRIRNVRLPPLLQPGQLIPIDVSKYDQRIVLEALHNCIAHQDYRACERVLVIERPGELEFHNAGGFFDGSPNDYVLGNRTPRRYRNRFLAEAMVNLRMIDTMGFGIRDVMFRGQARRYLPLPDFDVSDPRHVVLRIPGRFIDDQYSQLLLRRTDLALADIFALDRVQKKAPVDDATLRDLRRRGLVEGRKPHVYLSAQVAAVTDRKGDYIRTRRQDDAHYRHLILDFLRQYGEARREDLRNMLLKNLPDVLTAAQKENKLKNLLSGLRRDGRIVRVGGLSNARWRLG